MVIVSFGDRFAVAVYPVAYIKKGGKAMPELGGGVTPNLFCFRRQH